MLIRLLVCGTMAGARLLELRHSRGNTNCLAVIPQGRWSARTYPLVVAIHAAIIGGTAIRGSQRANIGWLALLLAVQPFRLWVLYLLGPRWNARGEVSASMAVETRGPYAVIRHPNYAVVVIELAALPLAFQLPRLAIFGGILNGCLLALRIRDEEAALMQVPGYQVHFARKPRFVPGIF